MSKQDGFQLTPAALAALLKGDFANAMIAATPGDIEMQEKHGQEDFVASTTLPQRAPWDQLTKLGFTRGKDVDDLFCEATLPAGWRKEATEHAMWSDLLDAQGRKRASIFYKAAFYDRDAFLNLLCRYGYGTRPVDLNDYKGLWYGAVTDQGEIIWHTETTVTTDNYAAKDVLRDASKKWLEEHYPDYTNPLAYWDE